jgi:osmotically-inducible protein OsmY
MTERPTVPVSYDDITRRVTPLPDSSYRPTEGEAYDAEHPAEPSELEALIAAGIRSAIADEPQLDGADVGVKVSGTTATLEGSVATSSDRRTAVEIAWSVPGVTAVVDELKVRLE